MNEIKFINFIPPPKTPRVRKQPPDRLTKEERKEYNRAYKAKMRTKRAEQRLALNPSGTTYRRCRACGERVTPKSYYYCPTHYTYGDSRINDVA